MLRRELHFVKRLVMVRGIGEGVVAKKLGMIELSVGRGLRGFEERNMLVL